MKAVFLVLLNVLLSNEVDAFHGGLGTGSGLQSRASSSASHPRIGNCCSLRSFGVLSAEVSHADELE